MLHILALFLVFFLVYENYLQYRIKKIFKINPLDNSIKLLSCKPCFSFWLTLPFAFIDWSIPLFIYSIIFIYENLKK